MCSNNPEPPAIIGEVNPLNEVAVDADSGNCTPDEQEFDMQAHYVQEPEADVTDNSVAAESTMEDERPNDIPSDEDFDSMSLEECLRFWALKTNQPHQSINMILDIIRKKTDGNQLPRCARSLLKTTRNATTNITEIGGGQYWYYGIKNCLADYYR